MAGQDLAALYAALSNTGVKALHDRILRATAHDDRLTAAQRLMALEFGNNLVNFGVAEFKDWRDHARALEAEMTRRTISFQPLGLQ